MKLLNWLNKKERAKKFYPHNFAKCVEPIENLPVIFASRAAYDRMWNYVDLAAKEIGWLGTAERIGKDFLIKEVFLFKQEAGATTCEITTEGLAEFATEILASREDGMEIVNSLMFWGHSHANIPTSASSQDDSQMEIFRQSGHPWFIRGILNKLGRMEFTIYLYESGIKIVDVEWLILDLDDEILRTEIEAEIKAKVSEKVYVAPAINVFPVHRSKAEQTNAKRGDEHVC